MRFDATIDFGRTLAWWPLSVLLRARGNKGVHRLLGVWSGVIVVCVLLALLEARFNWSGLPFRVGSWSLGFTFYPPVTLGALLTLWIGPAYGAGAAYLSTLVSGLYSGLSFPRAAFFALGSPIELLLLWFLLLILKVNPTLPRLRDWALFGAAGLIAATASSVDIMLYNATHKAALEEGQRLWLGWILGDFAQMMLLVAPVTWRYGARAHRLARRSLDIPPRREISTGRILLLLVFVWATLALLVLLGVQLLEAALDIPDYAITMSGDPLVPRLREMGLFVGVFVIVLLITTMALTAALAGVGDQHRERSLRDDLTGCFNRRAFKRLFDREAERSKGLGLPLSVVFFDVDHFKSLNDRHGHAAGDAVLSDIARQATDLLSAQELLFRWGGEEFVVLLSHTGAEGAHQFAERLRARIEERISVPGPAGREGVTISLGVATGSPGVSTEVELLESADAALYGAKAGGRNRVMTDRMMRGAPRI